jgi:AAA domain
VSMLTTIQRGRTSKPPRILVYGTEGIGKSTFGSQAPKPIFIQTEDGLDEIECDKFPLAAAYEDVVAALDELRSQQHDYETVVIDSMDWLERLVWDRLCIEHGVTSIEKVDGGYAKGYTHALRHWREIISRLNALRHVKGMVVLLIAHSKVERFEDPESSPYDRYSPRLHKHAAALVSEWCDAVVFATRRIRTQSEDTGFNRKRTVAHAIGKGGGERILRCVGGPSPKTSILGGRCRVGSLKITEILPCFAGFDE